MEASHLTVLIFLIYVSSHELHTYGQLMSSCPNTSCCACVSSPGCSWFSPPEGPSYCAQSPFLRNGLANGENHNVTPAYPSHVTITHNEPFHLTRPRLFQPQRALVDLAVGVRQSLNFQVLGRSARVRLQVRGPRRGNQNGEVEFGLLRRDAESCSRGGLREMVGQRGGRNRGRPTRRQTRDTYARRGRTPGASGGVPRSPNRLNIDNRATFNVFPRRRVYNCRGDGPGMVHRLSLELDVKKCLARPAIVKVYVRQPGGGRRSHLRVRVRSMCECPACSSNFSSSSSSTPTTPTTESAEATPSHVQADSCRGRHRRTIHCGAAAMNVTLAAGQNPQSTLCLRRGVNEVCVAPGNANTSSPAAVCSGRGMCLCGECVCSALREAPMLRYTGTHCECDDHSCARDNHSGMLCGGPQRGRCACGQCQCYPGFTGIACDETLSQETCMPPGEGEELSQVCSGRGMCRSGQCECPWPYEGEFCQCDNGACPRHQGELCGGEARGRCLCGSCTCRPGYHGPACELGDGPEEGGQDTPPASCMNSDGGDGAWPLVCSGRGVCLQGRCSCPTPYTGSLCQDCPSC